METGDELSGRRAWLDRWRCAREELERQRTRDLSVLGEGQAREVTRELLSMWRPDPSPRAVSGLVEQQRMFGAFNARRPGRAR